MDSPTAWQVHILGTAQDGGVPHFGCYRPCCQRAREDAACRRLVACLGLVSPTTGQAFLIDATPDIREQVDRLPAPPPPQNRGGPRGGRHHQPTGGRHHQPTGGHRQEPNAGLDAILLTHAHIGHYTGLIQLSKEVLNSRDLPVYCTPRMATFLAHNAPWDQLVRDRNVRLCVVRPGETVPLAAGLSVDTLPVPHRAEYTDTLAFRICGPQKSLLYLPDIDGWDQWEQDLSDVVESVDYAFLDGSFYSTDELPWRDLSAIGHPLIRDTMQRLGDRHTASRAQVYFIHLNHTNPALDARQMARQDIEARGYHVADEGLVLNL